MRVLGVDLGDARIGIAVSDPRGILAFPDRVIRRSGSSDDDLAAIVRAAEELQAESIIIGLPLSLDGRDGPAARNARAEAERLKKLTGIPVEMFDERFTTSTASKGLHSAGIKMKNQKESIDMAAAAVLLQAYLERAS